MPSPWALLKQSIQLFISNFVYFLKLWLIMVGLILAVALPAIIAGSIEPSSLFFLLIGASTLLLFVLAIWATAAMYSQVKTAVENNPQPIKKLLGMGWQIAAKVFLTILLSSLITILGLVFLVIPGIIVGVWFWLATPVVLVEGKWGWQALRRSRELVAGRFWKVLWYATFPTLVIIVLQLLVGLMGTGLNVLFSIISIPVGTIITLYLFLAYKVFAPPSA